MVVAHGHIIQYIHKIHACTLPGIHCDKIFARTGGSRNLAIIRPTQTISPVTLYCLGGSVGRATALKAGGCGFESHLSSFFSMKIEKRALRFVSLPLIEV